ncbi:MAG TPA: hypothetical protein VNT81_00960 [Vicinamibacterales bacterium]|nr:hypothetical protein [Vicinamibacterales bacterium]
MAFHRQRDIDIAVIVEIDQCRVGGIDLVGQGELPRANQVDTVGEGTRTVAEANLVITLFLGENGVYTAIVVDVLGCGWARHEQERQSHQDRKVAVEEATG